MPNDRDMVSVHNEQVGLLCAQWAYLEWLLEVAIWWFNGLLNADDDEREKATGGKSITALANEAADHAHRKLSSTKEHADINDVARRIKEALDERNLAVHGVRQLMSDESVLARVTRGKYKGTLQRLPPMSNTGGRPS